MFGHGVKLIFWQKLYHPSQSLLGGTRPPMNGTDSPSEGEPAREEGFLGGGGGFALGEAVGGG